MERVTELLIHVKIHNFACLLNKQVVFSCVETGKNYAVLLKDFGNFDSKLTRSALRRASKVWKRVPCQ